MADGINEGDEEGTVEGIAVLVYVGGIEGLLSEHVAQTFKDLAVLSQGSLPKTVLVAKTLQEFNPRHDEVIVAVVVFKAHVEIRKGLKLTKLFINYNIIN
jgi:hypothetical protein